MRGKGSQKCNSNFLCLFEQLAEEREKYMKSLEMELRKLQTANTDATNNFDERLNQLFVKKIKTEAVILQVCFSFKKKDKKNDWLLYGNF